jgi:hypothetical protein
VNILKLFFAELKRQNGCKVAIAYGLVGWLVIHRWQEITNDKLKI